MGGSLASGGEIAGTYGDGIPVNQIVRALISGAAGCAGASVTGGKCAGAAVTAAFANIYNAWGARLGYYLGSGGATACVIATSGACGPLAPWIVSGGVVAGAGLQWWLTRPAVNVEIGPLFSDGGVAGGNTEVPDGKGCVYCVDGEKTSSGKPCVGSTDNKEQREKDNSDGRDRTGAKVIGTYDLGDRDGRRAAEQQAINNHGGIGNLDNRRNEIAREKWTRHGVR